MVGGRALSSRHKLYQDCLIRCLNDASKSRFVALLPVRGNEDGLEIEEFVSFFADEVFLLSPPDLRKWLDTSSGYADLKAFLFVVFRSIDTDDSGTASWEEVIEFLIEERMAVTETPDEAEQRWRPSVELRYSTTARLHLADVTRSRGATTATRVGRDLVLPITSATVVKYFEPCGLLFALTRQSPPRFLEPGTWRIIATMLAPHDNVVSATMPNRGASSNFDTLVTSHRDRTVKVWSMRDSLSTDQKILELEFSYNLDAPQSALAACPTRPHVLFCGGADGGVSRLDITKENLVEYRRGDGFAFGKIIAQRWAPGEWHNDGVTALGFLEGMPSLVASVGQDGVLCMHDVETSVGGVRRLQHRKGLLALATTRCYPSAVITAGFDPSAYVWDALSHAHTPSITLTDYKEPHLAAIVSVETSRHAAVAITLDATFKAKFWDLRMGRCLQTHQIESKAEAQQSAAGAGPVNCSMSVDRKTSKIYFGGRSLHIYEVDTLSDPECSFHTDIIATAYCERSMHIMTVHQDAVVLWACDTGTIVAVHRHKAPPIDQLPGEPEEPETIRAFALAPSGVNYSIGTSRGRITRHRQRSGELIFDSGRLHQCEVRDVFVGSPPNDSEFLMSVGVDGSCVITSRSNRLPPHLPSPFQGRPPTALIFIDSSSQLVFGSDNGTAALADPYTYASKGVQSRLAVGDDAVTTLTHVASLSVLAVGTANGTVSVWGARPHVRTGYQLARFVATRGDAYGVSSVAVSPKAPLDSNGAMLFVGDEQGFVTTWLLEPGRTSADIRPTQLWRLGVSDSRVVCLHYIAAADRLICSTGDRLTFLVDGSGQVTGQLCHGRGSEYAVWKAGVPPYDFPSMAANNQRERAKALKVIKIVQRFITTLKMKAERRRALESRASMLLRRGVSLARTRSMRCQSEMSQFGDHIVDSCGESTEQIDADDEPMRPPAEFAADATLCGPQESEALLEALQGAAPLTAAKPKVMLPQQPSLTLRPRTAPRRYRASVLEGGTYLGTVASQASLARPGSGRPPGLTSQVRLTTEERIEKHDGFLTVLDNFTHSECSPRETVRVMDREYKAAEAQQRQLRELQCVEFKFRHAVRASDVSKHQRAAAAVQQIKQDAVEAVKRLAEDREKRLRGPPLPPAMISRARPATHR
jgi:WD40 repeat protein